MMQSQPVHFHPKPETFKQNAVAALADAPLRQSLRTAMDSLMSKRKAVLSDEYELQALRTLCEHIRQHALSRLPELLLQLEEKLTALGVQVHWAETPTEACHIIHRIMNAKNGKLMVKGKSMVSEEIELNHYLEAQGLRAVESDMGEYIVQMAGEKPTHIVMPAIHKTKQQVSEASEQILHYRDVGGRATASIHRLVDDTQDMAQAIAYGANVSFMEVVKLDHIVFKLEIYKAVMGYHTLQPDSIASHQTCRLGKWYYQGRGQQECGDLPAFRQLETPHQQVHDYARHALVALEIGDRKEAEQSLLRMERASAQVMTLLTEMESIPCAYTLDDMPEDQKVVKPEKVAA